MDFDPTTLLEPGTAAAVLATIVWVVKGLGRRIDLFVTRLESVLERMVETQKAIQLEFTAHAARDDVVQADILTDVRAVRDDLSDLRKDILRDG